MRSKLKKIQYFVCFLTFLISATAFAASPSEFRVGEFTFQRPAKWHWIAVTSPMRKAELKVVDTKTKHAAEVVFYAGFGGGVSANVERWFRQFQGSKEQIQARMDHVKVGKRTVTYAQAQGTYLSGRPVGPKTPKANYALLAAIVPSSQGDVFVKMTGPAELVKRSTEEFKKMVEHALK